MASAKRLQQEAYRAWFVGLVFNAVAGSYTLWQLRQREQNIDKNEGEGVVESKKIVKYDLPGMNFVHALISCTGNETQRTSSSSPTCVISLFLATHLDMQT